MFEITLDPTRQLPQQEHIRKEGSCSCRLDKAVDECADLFYRNWKELWSGLSSQCLSQLNDFFRDLQEWKSIIKQKPNERIRQVKAKLTQLSNGKKTFFFMTLDQESFLYCIEKQNRAFKLSIIHVGNQLIHHPSQDRGPRRQYAPLSFQPFLLTNDRLLSALFNPPNSSSLYFLLDRLIERNGICLYFFYPPKSNTHAWHTLLRGIQWLLYSERSFDRFQWKVIKQDFEESMAQLLYASYLDTNETSPQICEKMDRIQEKHLLGEIEELQEFVKKKKFRRLNPRWEDWLQTEMYRQEVLSAFVSNSLELSIDRQNYSNHIKILERIVYISQTCSSITQQSIHHFLYSAQNSQDPLDQANALHCACLLFFDQTGQTHSQTERLQLIAQICETIEQTVPLPSGINAWLSENNEDQRKRYFQVYAQLTYSLQTLSMHYDDRREERIARSLIQLSCFLFALFQTIETQVSPRFHLDTPFRSLSSWPVSLFDPTSALQWNQLMQSYQKYQDEQSISSEYCFSIRGLRSLTEGTSASCEKTFFESLLREYPNLQRAVDSFSTSPKTKPPSWMLLAALQDYSNNYFFHILDVPWFYSSLKNHPKLLSEQLFYLSEYRLNKAWHIEAIPEAPSRVQFVSRPQCEGFDLYAQTAFYDQFFLSLYERRNISLHHNASSLFDVMKQYTSKLSMTNYEKEEEDILFTPPPSFIEYRSFFFHLIESLWALDAHLNGFSFPSYDKTNLLHQCNAYINNSSWWEQNFSTQFPSFRRQLQYQRGEWKATSKCKLIYHAGMTNETVIRTRRKGLTQENELLVDLVPLHLSSQPEYRFLLMSGGERSVQAMHLIAHMKRRIDQLHREELRQLFWEELFKVEFNAHTSNCRWNLEEQVASNSQILIQLVDLVEQSIDLFFKRGKKPSVEWGVVLFCSRLIQQMATMISDRHWPESFSLYCQSTLLPFLQGIRRENRWPDPAQTQLYLHILNHYVLFVDQEEFLYDILLLWFSIQRRLCSLPSELRFMEERVRKNVHRLIASEALKRSPALPMLCSQAIRQTHIPSQFAVDLESLSWVLSEEDPAITHSTTIQEDVDQWTIDWKRGWIFRNLQRIESTHLPQKITSHPLFEQCFSRQSLHWNMENQIAYASIGEQQRFRIFAQESECLIQKEREGLWWQYIDKRYWSVLIENFHWLCSCSFWLHPSEKRVLISDIETGETMGEIDVQGRLFDRLHLQYAIFTGKNGFSLFDDQEQIHIIKEDSIKEVIWPRYTSLSGDSLGFYREEEQWRWKTAPHFSIVAQGEQCEKSCVRGIPHLFLQDGDHTTQLILVPFKPMDSSLLSNENRKHRYLTYRLEKNENDPYKLFPTKEVERIWLAYARYRQNRCMEALRLLAGINANNPLLLESFIGLSWIIQSQYETPNQLAIQMKAMLLYLEALNDSSDFTLPNIDEKQFYKQYRCYLKKEKIALSCLTLTDYEKGDIERFLTRKEEIPEESPLFQLENYSSYRFLPLWKEIVRCKPEQRLVAAQQLLIWEARSASQENQNAMQDIQLLLTLLCLVASGSRYSFDLPDEAEHVLSAPGRGLSQEEKKALKQALGKRKYKDKKQALERQQLQDAAAMQKKISQKKRTVAEHEYYSKLNYSHPQRKATLDYHFTLLKQSIENDYSADPPFTYLECRPELFSCPPSPLLGSESAMQTEIPLSFTAPKEWIKTIYATKYADAIPLRDILLAAAPSCQLENYQLAIQKLLQRLLTEYEQTVQATEMQYCIEDPQQWEAYLNEQCRHIDQQKCIVWRQLIIQLEQQYSERTLYKLKKQTHVTPAIDEELWIDLIIKNELEWAQELFPELSDKYLIESAQHFIHFLSLSVFHQRLNQIKASRLFIPSIDIDAISSQNMALKISLLLFSHRIKKIPRTDQIADINRLVYGRACILQRSMGSGKTSIAVPHWSFAIAQQGHLPIFFIEGTQCSTAIPLLQETLHRAFSQTLWHFNDRKEALTLPRLQWIIHCLEKGQRDKSLLVLRPEMVILLQLELILTQKKRFQGPSSIELEQREAALIKIGQNFSKAYGLGDEVDQLIHSKKEVNIAMGQPVFLSSQRIQLVYAIFSLLVSDAIKVNSLSMREYIALERDGQILLNETIWQQQIIPILAAALADHSLLRHPQSNRKTDVIEFLQSELNRSFEPLKPYWDTHPTWLNRVCIAKRLIWSIIPTLFRQAVGKDFGRKEWFDHNDIEVDSLIEVRPYSGTRTPSHRLFGDPDTKLTAHYMTALRQKIPPRILIEIAQYFLNKATEEAKKQRCQINQTPAAKEFHQQTSLTLSQMNDDSLIQQACHTINQDPQRKLWCESITAQRFAFYYPQRIALPVAAFVHLLRKFSGLSATPWNHLECRAIKERHWEEGLDGKLLAKLVHHDLSQKIHCVANFTNIHALFECVAADDWITLSGIFDCGAFFKDEATLYTAQTIFSYLKSRSISKRGVLFFHQEKSNRGELTALIEEEGKERLIPFHEAPATMLKERGWRLQDFFVFLDESHTTAIDLAFSPNAQALILVQENTSLYDYFQTCKRLRLDSQKTILIYPKREEQDIPFHQILLKLAENQARKQADSLLQSYQQKIESACFMHYLHTVLSPEYQDFSFETKELLFHLYEPFLFQTHDDNIIPLFAAMKEQLNVDDFFCRQTEIFSQKWSDRLEHFQERMTTLEGKDQDQLQSHFRSFQTNWEDLISDLHDCLDHMPIKMASQTADPLGNTLAEHEVQVEVQVQVQVETEQLQEDDDLNRYEQAGEHCKTIREEIPWEEEVAALLANPLYYCNRKYHEKKQLYTVRQLFESPTPFQETPYRHNFTSLFASSFLATLNFRLAKNYFLTVFHPLQKGCDNLLATETNGQKYFILLSAKECGEIKQFLLTNTLDNVWLIRSDGLPLLDSTKPFPIEHPTCKRTLVEINVFGGTLSHLSALNLLDEFYRWLREGEQNTKVQFLTLRCARNPKEKELLEQLLREK